MNTKEVAHICGVSIPTVTENAKKVGIIFENGKAHEWTEEELKKVQVQLMKNTTARGNSTTSGRVVEETALNALKGGLTIQELIRSGNVEAVKEFTQMAIEAAEQQNALIESQKQNQLLLEQYQNEKQEHQKDKELVLHKYLTATQIKETIFKEYGKKIVVSKAVQRIPLEDNDILYKPFKNGEYTGQQPVYHPNVLDKIREILG